MPISEILDDQLPEAIPLVREKLVKKNARALRRRLFNRSTKVGTSGGKPDGLRVIVPGKLGGGFDGRESRRDRGGAARRLRGHNFVVKLIAVEIDQS
ncbi:hypothetical protein E4U59_004020 [Claviceps monticola]|nr:hypothetical protein E4U59_004020 [Claviceps monticola]